MPTLEELPEEGRKSFLEHRKAAAEARKAQEDQKLRDYLACFTKDRQGNAKQVKNFTLPPIKSEVTTTMPTSAFDSDVANMVDAVVCANLNNRLDTITKNLMILYARWRTDLIKKYFDNTFDIPTTNAEKSIKPLN